MSQLTMLNRGDPIYHPPQVGLFEDDQTGEVWLMRLQRLSSQERSEYIYDRTVERAEAERIMRGEQKPAARAAQPGE
jgi:hypothetical protein